MTSEVRIIGGEWRSRRIRFAPTTGVRPTPDRVRETLFNWLGQRLDGLRCLDLFAGSGALGFEAASRGAACVVLVEQDARSVRQLQLAARTLAAAAAPGAARLAIVRSDALEYLRHCTARFDVVFLDPPFASALVDEALALLPPRLNQGARVYVERGTSQAPACGWTRIKQARAGQVQFCLLQHS